MPRIEADNDDADDQDRTRSSLVIEGLRQQLDDLEAQHREGKSFRNVVMVVDAVDPAGEPDFGVMTADDSLLTTVVGMLALAQTVSATQGLKIEDSEIIPKPPKPTSRLM